MARTSLKSLLKGRPDTNAENPQYLAEMVEVLSWLTPEEHALLTHPRNGLQTTLKYLPTPADVHGFLRAIEEERKAREQRFAPAPTAYRKIEDDPNAPWNQETDAERKKRVVREKLGYDPDGVVRDKRSFTPPTDADLASIEFKTKPAPPSEELLQLLRRTGYKFPGEQA